jgi:hypothetical protein
VKLVEYIQLHKKKWDLDVKAVMPGEAGKQLFKEYPLSDQLVVARAYGRKGGKAGKGKAHTGRGTKGVAKTGKAAKGMAKTGKAAKGMAKTGGGAKTGARAKGVPNTGGRAKGVPNTGGKAKGVPNTGRGGARGQPTGRPVSWPWRPRRTSFFSPCGRISRGCSRRLFVFFARWRGYIVGWRCPVRFASSFLR